MNVIPLQRLVWKEYRLLRSAWVTLFLVGFMFQLLTCLFRFDLRFDNRNEIVWTITWVVAIIDLIAALAMTFAGEREERTAGWMVLLSPAPGWTLASKLGAALASAISLGIALAVIALLVSGLPVAPLTNEFRRISFWPTFLGVFVFGALGSLLSRRAMSSIPAMCLWWGLTLLLPTIYFFDETGAQGTTLRVYANCSVAFFPVMLWVGWRWSQGKYWDGVVLVEVVRQYSRRLMLVFPQVQSKVIAVGVKSVQNRVEHSQPWRRAWQRLLWQERQREWLHLPVLVAVGLAAIWAGFRVEAPFHSGPGGWKLLSWILCLFVVPTFLGVMGFRLEDEGQPLRFLSHRAVSPQAIWLAKHVVWLPRAFVIPLLLWIGTFVAEWANSSWAPFPGDVRSLVVRETDHELNIHRLGIPLQDGWLVLFSYTLGHLSALMNRRMIVSLMLAFLINIPAGIWMFFTVQFEIPWWCTCVVPLVGIWLLTLWRSQPWLLEEQSFALQMRQIGGLVCILIVTLACTAVYRMYEPIWTLGPYVRHAEAQTGFVLPVELSVLRNPPPRQTDPGEYPAPDELLELMKKELPGQVALNHFEVQRDLLKSFDRSLRENRDEQALETCFAGLKLTRMLGGYTLYFPEKPYENLVVWANRPQQTPEMIQKVIRRVSQELEKLPATTAIPLLTYEERWKQIHQSLNETDARIPGIPNDRWWQKCYWYSWEGARLRNLMDQDLKLSCAALAAVEAHLRNFNGSTPIELAEKLAPAIEAIKRLYQTCSFHDPFANSLGSSDFSQLEWTFTTLLDHHLYARATMFRLALIADRKEHGLQRSDLKFLQHNRDLKKFADPWSDLSLSLPQDFVSGEASVQSMHAPIPFKILQTHHTFPIPPAP